ncbi:MAG: DUF429 domain-containing protein [Deltaproteobacteria bacterium]|nr:DUF429 domain-containing protein [Deltaproteobacteria bacterium]
MAMEARDRVVVNSRIPRRWVCGVDFSGARDAGERIWIARCSIGEDALHVSDLFQAKYLPGSGKERKLSHRALASFIGEQKDAIFGLDFPFSLPRDLVYGKTWEEFVLTFGKAFRSPEDFRERCRSEASGRELKRTTDIVSRTPFSPYNLRVYRQTYFGIRDVLAPLIRADLARILPMQQPRDGKAWVLEICPASTLTREQLRAPYKGRAEVRRTARIKILQALEKRLQLGVATSVGRSNIAEDCGGDALDSVIAAYAAFRASRNSFACDAAFPYEREGWVYV